jgi:hypothetical protein
MVLARNERRGRTSSALILSSLVCFLWAHASRAQKPDRALEFEDLGFTRFSEVSARAAGLAGFVPVVNDATALVYNPAGLARVKKRTPQLGLSRESAETITTHDGPSSGLSSDRVGLQFIGGASAIRVFQGSLVPAAAVYRAFVSDLNLAYEAINAADGRRDAYRIEQSGSTFAFSIGFGIDLASSLSAGVSMFALEGGYHTVRQWQTRTTQASPAVEQYVIEDIDGDLDGVGARVGFVLYAHRHAHIAVNLTTPTIVSASTNQTRETTEIIENSTGTFVRSTTSTSADYLIPYRLDGGIAFPWADWLLAVQAATCDWSQAAIDEQRLRLQNGSAALGKTLELRAGLEWTTPWWPLRVRAGIARLPFAPDYIQADRIDNDRLEAVAAESVPMRYSLGAGVALKRSILIDAVFTRTTGERSAASFSETREWSQVVIEGSYWF